MLEDRLPIAENLGTLLAVAGLYEASMAVVQAPPSPSQTYADPASIAAAPASVPMVLSAPLLVGEAALLRQGDDSQAGSLAYKEVPLVPPASAEADDAPAFDFQIEAFTADFDEDPLIGDAFADFTEPGRAGSSFGGLLDADTFRGGGGLGMADAMPEAGGTRPDISSASSPNSGLPFSFSSNDDLAALNLAGTLDDSALSPPAVSSGSAAGSSGDFASFFPTSGSLSEPRLTTPSKHAIQQSFGKLPLVFEVNQGQVRSAVKYLARGQGYNVSLTDREAVLVLSPPASRRGLTAARDVLKVKFASAAPAQIRGENPLPSRSNYFIGRTPRVGLTDIPHFGRVVHEGLYNGIDLISYGTQQGKLEFDLVVKPNADPGVIRLQFEGVVSKVLDGAGHFRLRTAGGEVVQQKPIIYQMVGNSKQFISGGYRLNADGSVGFTIGSYDRSKPLIIDPVLDYSTYLGGALDDEGLGIAVDGEQNAYITGSSLSPDFPLEGGLQLPPLGEMDAFVTKISPDGQQLVYSTFYGGSGADRGQGIAVDAGGFAHIVGSTTSPDLPVPGGFQYVLNGARDAFVAKLSPAGNALSYATYLGGEETAVEDGFGIALDFIGYAVVTGQTDATDFPTTPGAFQPTNQGLIDAFLTKLDYFGGLGGSTYLGGPGVDLGRAVAVDTAGMTYVGGSSNAPGFPTTPGARQPVFAGGSDDGFVVRLEPDQLLYGTYVGGSGEDRVLALAVDEGSSAYAGGYTTSANFPTTPGAFQTTPRGLRDGFVAKLNEAGSAYTYATYLGGNGNDEVHGLVIDAQQAAYATGITDSTNWTLVNPLFGAGGGQDAFVTRLNDIGSALLFSTYLGGDNNDVGEAIALDFEGNAFVTGSTYSNNFPTSRALQSSLAGGSDAFVARINRLPRPPVITRIEDDTPLGSSPDAITQDQRLILHGTADADATIRVRRAGIGDLTPTVQADPMGDWNYDYTLTLLEEGQHVFTATATIGPDTSLPSAEFKVIVDLTPPEVQLNAPATTTSVRPQVRITAKDLNGIPDGTQARLDIDRNNDGDFDDLNEMTQATGALKGEFVEIDTPLDAFPPFPPGTYKLRARVTDLAGNEGFSAVATVLVLAVGWSMTSDVGVRSVDPEVGQGREQIGVVQVAHALDLDRSPGSGQGGNPALIYHSDRVRPRPIVQVTLQSGTVGALPASATVQLWWKQAGAPSWTAQGPERNVGLGLRYPGDKLVLAAQVVSPVTQTGRYEWKMQVTVPGIPSPFKAQGHTYVIVDDQLTGVETNAIAPGWTWSMIDRLVYVPEQQTMDETGETPQPLTLPEGQLRIYGTGSWRFYQKTGATSFSSPLEDNGTLVKNGNGTFTYTTPDQRKWLFYADGMQSSWQSADGFENITFIYNDVDGDGKVDDLISMTAIDTSGSSVLYTGGKVNQIVAPNARVFTLARTANDLTLITDPDSRTHGFGYGAANRLQSETRGSLVNSWGYSPAYGTLSSWTWGDPALLSTWTISPASLRGLGEYADLGPAEAATADPLTYVTRSWLDQRGRPTQQFAADGGLWQWKRYPSGRVEDATDPLGRLTHFVRDAQGYVTREDLPGGASRSYEYLGPNHGLTKFTDERGHASNYAYFPDGHLQTAINALDEPTNYQWTNGLLTMAIDPLLRPTTFFYDGFRRLERVTTVLPSETVTSYDANGHVSSILDPRLNQTFFICDAMGRLTDQDDPGPGGLWKWTYTTAGLPDRATDAMGRIAQNEYDSRGLTTRTLQALGTSLQRTFINSFNPRGEATGARDANAIWTYAGFDPVGRLAATQNAVGGVSIFVHDRAGQTTFARDPLGATTRNAYNLRGWVSTTWDPANVPTTVQYDPAGNPTHVTDVLNRTWVTEYDKLHRPTKVTDPLLRYVQTSYDTVGNVRDTIDAMGRITRHEYDVLNRLRFVREAFGTPLVRTTETRYDANSNVTKIIDPTLKESTYDYDLLNRPWKTTDHLGKFTITTFDAVGNATSFIDQLNKTTVFGVDALNRVTAVTDPLQHQTQTRYDPMNNPTVAIDALNNATTTYYDPRHLPVWSVDSLGGQTQLWRDGSGNVTFVTDPVGNMTRFEYDRFNREVKRIDPLGKTSLTVFDAVGRVDFTVDRRGWMRDLIYEPNGNRVVNELWKDPIGFVVETLGWTYNNNDRVLTSAKQKSGGPVYATTRTYDQLNRVQTESNPWGQTLTFGYNLANDRTSMTDSLGGVVTSDYDDLHRLRWRTFTDGQTSLRMDLTYTDRSQLWTLRRASNLSGSQLVGTTTLAHDDAGRLTQLQHLNAAPANIANYVYGYDNANRLTSDSLNGVAKTYQYDRTNQLTSDNGTPYNFDLNGNRAMPGYGIGTANRIITFGEWTYLYDFEGNLIKKTKGVNAETWTYDYDHRNQLVNVEKRTTDGGALELHVQYEYDAEGRRIEERKWKQSTGWVTQRFAYDGPHIWGDLTGSSSLTTRRLYLDAIDAVFARIGSTGDLRWYLPDRLGSIRDITDSNSNVLTHLDYSAWGVVTNETNPTNGDGYGWTGRVRDRDTLLQNNRRRETDVETGRMIQEDPIGFADDINPHRYTHNSPTNATDPTGLWTAEGTMLQFEKKYGASGRELLRKAILAGLQIQGDGGHHWWDEYAVDGTTMTLSIAEQWYGYYYDRPDSDAARVLHDALDRYFGNGNLATRVGKGFARLASGSAGFIHRYEGQVTDTDHDNVKRQVEINEAYMSLVANEAELTVKRELTWLAINYLSGRAIAGAAGALRVLRALRAAQKAHKGLVIASEIKVIRFADAWRKGQFANKSDSIVYILRDAKTGEILKVGKTEVSKFVGRFEDYARANSRLPHRELELDAIAFDSKKYKATTVEKEIRNELDRAGHKLPWDNTDQRLGRAGPGTPFTTPKQGYYWDGEVYRKR